MKKKEFFKKKWNIRAKKIRQYIKNQQETEFCNKQTITRQSYDQQLKVAKKKYKQLL